MSENTFEPTKWAVTFTASGTVGKGTGPDPDINEEK